MPRAVMCALLAGAPHVHAGPAGEHIVAGQAAVSRAGNNTLITQSSDRAAINWQSFNIGAAEAVRFAQPSASSIALNRVLGQNPTEILGALSANGQVFIVNPNGVLFGKSAQVDVGGLIASTLSLRTDDFMAGRYRFSADGLSTGGVTNQGNILANGGYIALIGPSVKNEGTLTANNGSAALAAGDSVTVNLNGNKLLGLTVEQGTLNALADNKGLIKADGGQAILTAKAADQIIKAVVNNDGVVEANTLTEVNGVIRLEGGMVTNTGVLRANGNTSSDGGSIDIRGVFVGMGGSVSADGANGGSISVQSQGNLSLAENVSARGLSGRGGRIDYLSGGRLTEIDSSRNDASGATDGGRIGVNAGGGMLSSGHYAAKGDTGAGGYIDLSGLNVRLLSAQIDASGASQGGRVRVGGAFQGGKTPDTAVAYYDSFVGRWGDNSPLAESQRTFINDSTRINVSSGNGAGGTGIVWSSKETTMLGGINARGATSGSIEISSAETLRRAGLVNVHSGAGGYLLLDPKNITIGDAATVSNWSLQAILGSGYVGGKNVNVVLDNFDQFGSAVAFNAAGDRLAVGARGDGLSTGAVHLFAFSDNNFNGGALTATLGSGYTGGKNVNLALDANDAFGYSVSLNAAGDRLAVGAFGDQGAGNVNGTLPFTAPGAVYLFTFADQNFSGGTLASTLGLGYSGGKNVNVPLNSGDAFGSAVALNAAGDRLAVGAPSDDGAGNANSSSGAVHLFTFTDTSFSGGALAATLGSGYSGGKNVNVALDNADLFGSSVAFNAAGDRLAVGARHDSGFGNANSRSGAVHLFTFTDTSFSGGVLAASMGSGYSGGKNVNVVLDSVDEFGTAVSLNAAGDRLAVGAPGDGGAGNAKPFSGAVHLFGFTDNSFSGGSLAATLGSGYSGGKNVNVPLDNTDTFGSAVALNAAGDRLAVGAIGDGGAGNSNTMSGAVYFFTGVTESGPAPIQNYAYAQLPGQTITLRRSDLESLLSQGTAVSLQASNDITLNSALTVNNAAGNGGALTLQAGRSIVLNRSVTTDNGNVTLIANDTLANGVIDAQRDAGNAAITMAAGTSINAGTGAVNIELRDGTGKTNSASGAITLGSISAGTILVTNRSGGIIVDSGAMLTASGTGDALVLGAVSGGGVLSNGGALSAPNGRLTVTNGQLTLTNSATPLLGGLSVLVSNPGGTTVTNSAQQIPAVLGALTSALSRDAPGAPGSYTSDLRLNGVASGSNVGNSAARNVIVPQIAGGTAGPAVNKPITVEGSGINLPPGVK